jgi:hypothetical protein
MLTVLKETKGDLVALCVTKTFTSADFELYSSLVRGQIEKSRTPRVYFEMQAFKGWELAAFVKNAVFDLVHGRQFGRVAMVGSKNWQKWAARLASPVKKYGIKYFDVQDKRFALQWVTE